MRNREVYTRIRPKLRDVWNTKAGQNYGSIVVRGARESNLKSASLDLPKRRITVCTGVSGSGKSSLVFNTFAAQSPRRVRLLEQNLRAWAFDLESLESTLPIRELQTAAKIAFQSWLRTRRPERPRYRKINRKL